MKFILFNLTFSDNKLLETEVDNMLKEVAYSAKRKDKTTKMCEYDYILFPISEYPISESDDVIGFMKSHCGNVNDSNEIEYDLLLAYQTLYYMFYSFNYVKFTFDIIRVVNDNELSLYYSDGSSSPKTTDCGYATLILTDAMLKEDVDAECPHSKYYEILTEKYYSIIEQSGKVSNGTNNIGELTGVKVAVESMNKIEGTTDKTFQVIVSDSEYALKSYREWIHNWKKNGYKASNKKPIANKDIILETQSMIENSGKIYLFKWVKGHSNLELNDICDLLAKSEIGII